jgi:hypothetical protein
MNQSDTKKEPDIISPEDERIFHPEEMTDEEIIREAVDRHAECEGELNDTKREAKEDLIFIAGDQWPEEVKKERSMDNRAMLTINRLPAFINQVDNDLKQNRMEIKVRPVDDGSDVEKADVINGIIRHVMNNRSGRAAVDNARSFAIKCGIGFLRVRTDYCNAKSFDQELIVERIDNPFSVTIPIHLCKEENFSDMPYAIITTRISKDEFKRTWPDADATSWKSLTEAWITQDEVMIAEYFKIITTKRNIVKLADGSVTYKEEAPEGVKIIAERETEDKKVMWYKMTSFSILEKGEFPGENIPIVAITGTEENIDGKKKYISLIRWAKDPQRLYNFWKTSEAENLAFAPISPFILYEDQIKGYEQVWQTANRKAHSYLPVKRISENGASLPLPQRVQANPAPQGLIEAAREAADDIKATTGIFDASLGARGNETSGRAILARAKQGDTANFHFQDNTAKSLQYLGRILVDIIPEIYDVPRTIRIIGEDKKDEVVRVNDGFTDKDGKQKLYDLTTGEYDIVCDTGPAYASRRQEVVETLSELYRVFPPAAQVTSDLFVKSMDAPDSDLWSRRLKTLIPPNALQDGKEPHDPMLQQVTQDLQKTIAERDQMKVMLVDAANQLKDKDNENELKIDIELLKSETALEIAKLKAYPDQIANMQQILLSQIAEIKNKIGNSQGETVQPQPMPPAPGIEQTGVENA